MWQRFVFYGFLGWITELIWTGLGSLLTGDWTLSGHSYLWMFPIYGCAVFFEPVYSYIREYHWYVRGIIWLFLIWVIEYFSGWVIMQLIGTVPWNYASKTPYQINGLIRLDYAPVWFAGGLIWEKIHNYLAASRMIGLK